jgi:hypothetical protein
LPVASNIKRLDFLLVFGFAIPDPIYTVLVPLYIAPSPASNAILFVPFPFILKKGSTELVAPISPTINSVSFNVIPPLRNDIPFKFVTILLTIILGLGKEYNYRV